MAQVPRVTRRVATQEIPGVRRTAAETETSLGVGVEQAKMRKAAAIVQVGQEIGQLGAVFEREAIKERERADDIALMEADNALAKWEADAIYNPETGALTKKGKDAMGLPEAVVGEYTKQADAIGNGLSTQRQRDAFAKIRLRREANIDMTLRRHTYQEIQRYEGQQLESLVTNATNAAIANGNDPTRVNEEIAKAIGAITTSGPRLGLTPEQVKQQTEAVQSQVYAGVMESLIDQNKTAEARAYWEEKGDKVTGVAHVRVEKALQAGTLAKRAQDESDQIMAANPDDTKAQLEAARKIQDGELRDQVERRIEHAHSVRDALEAEDHKKLTTDAKNMIDAGITFDNLPPTIKTQLTVGEAGALRNYEDWRAKPERAVKTDPSTYYQLVKQLTSDNPEEVGAFYKRNMMELVDKLSPQDWQQFVDLQTTGAAKMEDKARALLVNQANQNRMVDEAISGMGMDPTPPQVGTKGYDQAAIDRVNQFRRSVREAVSVLEFNQKKQATDEQVQQIVDRFRKPVVHEHIWHAFSKNEEKTTFAWEIKTYADLPQAKKDMYAAALKAEGMTPTPELVYDLYRRELLSGSQPKAK